MLILVVGGCMVASSLSLLVSRPDDPAARELRAAIQAITGDGAGSVMLDAAIDAMAAPPPVAPVVEAAAVTVPSEMENTIFALTYGRRNGWGTLRTAATGTDAVAMAAEFAGQVQQNTSKQVIAIVNPVIREKFHGRYDAQGDRWLEEIIATAAERGVIVMLDIQLGEECVPQGRQIISDYVKHRHVWFDIDVEHSCGGVMQASQLNELAAYFSTQRAALGYTEPALFGFWYFQPGSVVGQPLKQHGDILVVPMFNGFVSSGGVQHKIAQGRQRLVEMGGTPFGVMWFPKHDINISLADVMAGFPQALVVARQ